MIRILLQNAAAAALFLWARREGGAPERLLSGILLLSIWAALFLHFGLRIERNFHGVDPVSFLFDLWMLIAAIWIALNANRVWPLWFAALQIIAMTSHFLRHWSAQIHPYTYSILTRMPTYAQLLVLLFAMIACNLRQRRSARPPDWRH